ncbi:LysM peptidoglycan-binding domain-containing protein [Roseateles sp.]|uniref:LysM peptidoglycan-binding domain-containing protein n=1 Tax=Roseateles sp. TaxID=1971397 RepID=UPI0039E96D61
MKTVCKEARLAVTLGVALLSACAEVRPPAAAGRPAAPVVAAVPASAPAPEAAPAPAPAVPMSAEEVRAALESVRNLLDQGHEEAALGELDRVLRADPGNRAAQYLQRQIQEDPVVLFGRDSFSYVVKPGDTLAVIAQRQLGERDAFYGLARYNGIKVPRQLPLGQSIKLPGKPRPALAAPAAAPAPVAAAPQVATPVPPPVDPEVQARAQAQQTKAAINKASRAARVCMVRQDVCCAIRHWDEVLKLDPSNGPAQAERERAMQSLKKLNGKC